jgi:circadian clock protein KaiC
MVLGSPGSGKTVLGLSFLAAGAREKEPCLYFGFFETQTELVGKADGVGSNLSAHIKSGLVELEWHPPGELVADALAEKLFTIVKKRGIRRLFVDGLGGFKNSLVHRERTGPFFGAVCNELRALGVTTILSEETRDLFGPEIDVPVSGLAAMLDNIIFLRHVEVRARLHRIISVMKMREGAADPSLREFSISERGIDVSSTLESAEAILTGIARVNPGPAISPPSRGSPSPRGRKPGSARRR